MQAPEYEARIAELEARLTSVEDAARIDRELLNPLNQAMLDTFVRMVLKTNPINEEERATLEMIRNDVGAAPIEALYIGLHAAERELMEAKLTDVERTAYVSVLLILRAQLRLRGAYVETDEVAVAAALEAADRAGRVQG